MIPLLLLLLLTTTGWAADSTPPRLFFADAKISFTFPEHWDVERSFPYGPLFTRTTPEGARAFIACQISDPLTPDRLASDLSTDKLAEFAKADIGRRQGTLRVLATQARTLADHNAYELTWEDQSGAVPVEYQSEYFFVENRVYVLSLRAPSENFLWLVPEYQSWLGSVQVLSRRDSGALAQPAHGGLWVHQTGGARISIPDTWLIGVADDTQLGAAFVKGGQHSEFTAAVEALADPAKEFTEAARRQARESVEKRGFKILSESEEPFHGLPAFHLGYEGKRENRLIHGQDVWVLSPKGRWLLSIEADAPLFRQLADDYRNILNNIEFL